ncbi:hypothetical protein L2Y96_12575 [Luteibacter aegosomaticola]|uniref:hypothetical protein n=1 Tax=Luteibacter aegosomaticola TaxID=2911538 RepID=UPI001FFBF9F9|nr:hypothetical protein [Luteibacter aegosomaticola]UPG88254.1 hypothetical protein L2Y96_12575 [Luteibacter aegosomaticola]
MLDIHLQDGTSFPAAKALTASRVPVLFVSSCEPQEVPPELRARLYLRKPLAVREVMATLRELPHAL